MIRPSDLRRMLCHKIISGDTSVSPDNHFREVLRLELEKTLVEIANITRGRISRTQTFSDFIAYSALTLSIRTDPVHAEKRHNTLKQLKNTYRDAEWNSFHEGLVALSKEVVKNVQRDRFIDLFALTFIKIGAVNKELKQDFTPPDVAKLKANIVFRQDTALPQEGFFTLNDSTCGSGTILLAGVERIAELGFNPSAQLVVLASDYDPRCAQMAYLNLSLYGIPAVVVCGNTITLKESDRWYTPVYLLGKWIWRAPMPFGDSGYASDEMLRRYDEPIYNAIRNAETLFIPADKDGTADISKNHSEREVQP